MIYLDMDGVLMDFDRGQREHGLPVWQGRTYHTLPRDEWEPHEEARDKLVQGVMSRPNFWPSLVPMADAFLLWEHCAPWGHRVLTARPSSAEAALRVHGHKFDSIRTHFDGRFCPSRFICCLRSQKALYAKAGHVLVDDLPSNCQEWERAGGTAILHKDALSTIKILKELGYPHHV